MGRIALTERQITNRDVGEIFGISNRAALDEISGLVELKVIKQMGRRRSVHYVLEDGFTIKFMIRFTIRVWRSSRVMRSLVE